MVDVVILYQGTLREGRKTNRKSGPRETLKRGQTNLEN